MLKLLLELRWNEEKYSIKTFIFASALLRSNNQKKTFEEISIWNLHNEQKSYFATKNITCIDWRDKIFLI